MKRWKSKNSSPSFGVIANPMDDTSFYRVLRMDCFKIPMAIILDLIQKAKEVHVSLWSLIQKSEECQLLAETLNELIDYSKHHTAGEVLYQFAEKMKLYETYLKQGTIEAEEIILSIAAFFQKLREFQMQTDENSVLDFINYLDLAEEAGENPAARLEVGDREAIHVSSVACR